MSEVRVIEFGPRDEKIFLTDDERPHGTTRKLTNKRTKLREQGLSLAHSSHRHNATLEHLAFLSFYARQHVMLSSSLLRQRRPSVRPSVCLSVTLLYCVKTTQLRIMKSSLWATARTVVKIYEIFIR